MARMAGIAALAMILVPLVARPASAQDPNRSDHFRMEVSEFDDTIPQPPALVWRALRDVYNYLGFPLSGVSDTTAHVYQTPFLDIHGDFFNRPVADWFICQQYAYGAGDVNNSAIFTFAVRSEVKTAHGVTILRSQADARSRRRSWNASSQECTSNGLFEHHIARLVRQRLAELAPRPATPPPAPATPASPGTPAPAAPPAAPSPRR